MVVKELKCRTLRLSYTAVLIVIVLICFFQTSFHWISEEYYYISNENLMYITGVFLYLNSTINPVIYNLISAKYRKAFKETLFSPSKCCRYVNYLNNFTTLNDKWFPGFSRELRIPRVSRSPSSASCQKIPFTLPDNKVRPAPPALMMTFNLKHWFKGKTFMCI